MSLPRISVVTPSFNQAAYLEATLRSVLDQRYPNLEYIVIDGGSTDGSVDIIRRYADRLSFWVSERDAGQSDAIAKGLRRATGDIVAWLNSDDLYEPGALDLVARTFRDAPDVDFVYGSHRVIDAAGTFLRTYTPPTLLHKYYFAFGQWIPQESSFWRRSLYERAGGLEIGRAFAMDFSLFTRMWSLGRFRRIDAVLGSFRIHPESKTSQLGEVRDREAREIRRANGIPHFDSRRLYRLGEQLVHVQIRAEKAARLVRSAAESWLGRS
ncbi:MAG TPA: glycosyltransferase family 2 protein [Polyangia bacterium]|nr:glycosyltransferase family 2 protein [Polyangia bacterium]